MVQILKSGQNSEIWWKFGNLVKIVKFGQNCVKILKFGQTSEKMVKIVKHHGLVWFVWFDLGLRALNFK